MHRDDGRPRWWRNGVAYPLRGTPPHGPSTTIPHASGATAGQNWFNGSWPMLVDYAGSTEQVEVHHIRALKDLNPKGRNTYLNRPHGWHPATARSLSSAAPAMRSSTPDVPHGTHDEHWRAGCHGNRARPVRRGPSEKDQITWHLVGSLPYGTPGSGGGPGKPTRGNTGGAPRADPTHTGRSSLRRQTDPLVDAAIDVKRRRACPG